MESVREDNTPSRDGRQSLGRRYTDLILPSLLPLIEDMENIMNTL